MSSQSPSRGLLEVFVVGLAGGIVGAGLALRSGIVVIDDVTAVGTFAAVVIGLFGVLWRRRAQGGGGQPLA